MRIIAGIATHINIIMERIDITDRIALYNCDCMEYMKDILIGGFQRKL